MVMNDKQKKTEKEWEDKGNGKGPGDVQPSSKSTQKIDRYDWGGNLTEKSFMPRQKAG